MFNAFIVFFFFSLCVLVRFVKSVRCLLSRSHFRERERERETGRPPTDRRRSVCLLWAAAAAERTIVDFIFRTDCTSIRVYVRVVRKARKH